MTKSRGVTGAVPVAVKDLVERSPRAYSVNVDYKV